MSPAMRDALEKFDHWLGDFLPKISRDDLVIITADHGNDPTFRGTDHTREEVPLLVLHNGDSRNLGTRSTFADVAATLSDYFELPRPLAGWNFVLGNASLLKSGKCTFPASSKKSATVAN